jgi:acetyl-CoA/propionyl-CoA carboxylase biotin carboxyl carrier protein
VAESPGTATADGGPVVVEPGAEVAREGAIQVGAIGKIDQVGRRSVEVVVDGWRFELIVEDEARAALRDRARRHRETATGPGEALEIRAIIPGRIASVAVTPGDTVETGQTLLAVEAMKMQNELRAPRAGTVRRVPATAGATVEVGDVLVVLE